MHQIPRTATLAPRSEWPSTSHKPLFIYHHHDTGNQPASVLASVVDASPDATTYAVITCAPTLCEDGGDYPEQTIVESNRTLWIGASSSSSPVGDVVEKWACYIDPDGRPVGPDSQPAWCVVQTATGTLTAAGQPAEDWSALASVGVGVSVGVDECFVQRRMVAAVITAGMDKIYEVEDYRDPGSLDDMIDSLANVPCSTRGPGPMVTPPHLDGRDEEGASRNDIWGWACSESNRRADIFGDHVGTLCTGTTTVKTPAPTDDDDDDDDDSPAVALSRSLALVLGFGVFAALVIS